LLFLLSGIFMGWSLGANDAANVFGSAVASRMLKFWTAATLCSIFVILGAILEGHAGIETLGGLTHLTLKSAVISSTAAAITVTLMTLFDLPVSTSQAVVGAIIGIGILEGHLNLGVLAKVVTCWFGTPTGALVAAVVIFYTLKQVLNRLNLNMFEKDIVLRLCLIASGAYGAYTLGANNVANVTAVFIGAGALGVFEGTLIGGLSIASGVLTFSRGVMETIGSRLVRLDAFSALVAILAESVTLHFYSLVGVPVSASQAIIGAVLGIGVVKGAETIRMRALYNILSGWFMTPILACFLAFFIQFLSHLRYIPS